MGFARRAARRVVFMDQGRILESAPPDRFFDNPESARAREFLSKILAH
jgi:ABC-type polar amino acid transport system ATPase subunit